MLYLEDFLEMTEHLPAELRDRFTEMRELDLTVNNSVDSIEKKCKSVFGQCKRGELDDAAAEAQFDTLRKEFHKTYEDAEEKVNIATQVHDLVERYLRRLDGELYKFKCELEADNNGITEILERRSLEMENNSTVSKAFIEAMNTKENQEFMSAHINNQSQYSALSTPTATKEPRYRTVKSEKRKDTTNVAMTSYPEKKSNVCTFQPNLSSSTTVRSVTPNVNILNSNSSTSGLATTPIVNAGTNNNGVTYNLQQLGTTSASNAIAAAASQAIVATQNMPQGRRTASLKASYEAIHGAGGGPTEFWISRDIANAATAAAAQTTAVQHATPAAANMEKKQKKKFQSNVSNTMPIQLANNNGVICTGLPIRSSSSSVSSDSMDMINTGGLVCVDGVGKNLTLNSLGYGNVNTSYNANVLNASSSRETSSSSTTSTMLAVPSSNLTINENGMVVEHTPEGEWTYDPNEPRYCTCNQVSYGDMVACDNDACPYEWFHYPCVGITQPPKGKWFCPKCTVAMRRRGNRKN